MRRFKARRLITREEYALIDANSKEEAQAILDNDANDLHWEYGKVSDEEDLEMVEINHQGALLPIKK